MSWGSSGGSRSLTEYPACIRTSAHSSRNNKQQSDESISEEGERKPAIGSGMSQWPDLESQPICRVTLRRIMTAGMPGKISPDTSVMATG